MSALVRLRGRSHSGVQVPVRPKIHRPVTEGYCVVVTRGGAAGGELPVRNIRAKTKQSELDSARRQGEPASAVRSPPRSPSFPGGEELRPKRSRPTGACPRAERNSEPTKSRGLAGGWLETEWQEA